MHMYSAWTNLLTWEYFWMGLLINSVESERKVLFCSIAQGDINKRRRLIFWILWSPSLPLWQRHRLWMIPKYSYPWIATYIAQFSVLLNQLKLKVSKFQKQIFLFSFEPKNEWIYFWNSTLASKMSQIKKWRHFIILISEYLIQLRDYFFYLTHLRSLGQKKKSFSFWFKWEQENLLLKFTDLYYHIEKCELLP